MTTARARLLLLSSALACALPVRLAAQQGPLRLTAEPATLALRVGASAPLSVRVLDASGQPVDVAVRYAAPRSALRVRNGRVEALEPGSHEIVVTAALPAGSSGAPTPLHIPVTVSWPPIARLDVRASSPSLYVGTTITHDAAAFHADGTRRPQPEITWSSSAPRVATVDEYGAVTALAAGSVTITASVEGASQRVPYDVRPFPAVGLSIEGGARTARTGDVLHFSASGRTASGTRVDDLPVTWSYTFVPEDSIRAPGAAGIVSTEGAFVGEVPGRYTVLATSGPLTQRSTVRVTPRDQIRHVELEGQGAVRNQHTSDLWVFEGLDGRDHAITGTWVAAGWAFFWDVTDPTNLVKTDSIQLDARTVNDVKVPPNARYAALSREGASNRRNGIVILDMADPAHPTVASTFESNGVTGGVHNMFATDDYLFALAGGDKYVIIDMRDIRNPRYVSEYNHPNSRIHDVWVHDGIAYSSEWQNGVVVVDVGNGRWGGSIEHPVLVTTYAYPVGATHAAFPYFQESTGKFYLFLGDEISGGEGAVWEGPGTNDPYDPATGKGGVQERMDGYMHIIDFTDPMHPRDVARYLAQDAGTHNPWVEDDILYQAYYEGGLRIVDVSGELMGDLTRQGREIAVFKPMDPLGFLVNAPNVWSAQPYKGHIFFSDFNSGLWSVKLDPERRPIS